VANIVIFFYSGHQIILESHRWPVGVWIWPDVFGDSLATMSMAMMSNHTIRALLLQHGLTSEKIHWVRDYVCVAYNYKPLRWIYGHWPKSGLWACINQNSIRHSPGTVTLHRGKITYSNLEIFRRPQMLGLNHVNLLRLFSWIVRTYIDSYQWCPWVHATWAS